jgi:hypothetical protein
MTATEINLHLRFFCPLDEYQEIMKIFKMIMIGRSSEKADRTATREIPYIADFLSFIHKMTEGSGIVSDKPDQEVFADFECTGAEYEAALFIAEHSAAHHSTLCGNSNRNAETAIHSALFAKRLRQSPVLPDIEILLESEEGVFLKDLDRGNVSITNSAELVCRIFSHSKRIFYMDTEKQWAELVHSNGVFERFAPVSDREINRISDYPDTGSVDDGRPASPEQDSIP